MLHLDNGVVSSLLDDMKECVRVVEEAYQEWSVSEANSIPITAFLAPAAGENRFYQFGAMSAGSRKWKMFCIRMLDDIVHTRSYRGAFTREKYCVKPGTYCGFVLLFSTESGEPLALVNDGVLQHISVGVSAGVLVKYLSKGGSDSVGVLGTGGMARTFAAATCAVREIRKIRFYSPTKAHRKACASEMREKLGIESVAVDEPREAVRGADIVLCCTDSLKPVMFGRWLEPGMYVCSVQGEVDPKLIRKVDLNAGLSNDMLVSSQGSGTLSYTPWQNACAYYAGKKDELALVPRHRGIARVPHFVLLGDIMQGRHLGRTDDKQTVYSHAAGTNDSVRFVALAGLAYTRASKGGLGSKMPVEWFLENVRD